jgi:hypothetical protein
VAEWRYADYLAVKEDFIPVFTEEADRIHKWSWKAFIPHQQMKELLEKLIAALDRERIDEIKSFWLTGAYGTGKTFASFVAKHILEDDLAEVEEYFNKYESISCLWPRFKKLREKNNKYMVIYRSGAGHITTDRRLLLEVQQAITERLRALGYETFTAGIMDQMVEKLTGEGSIISVNWDMLFTKHRGRFRMAARAEDVVEALKRKDLEVGEIVAQVLEDENVALADSPTAVKEWLKEVIAKNNLGGIVFIWDEFTEFFNRNRNVTTLQELAHATQEMPFYLFVVTHRALQQFTSLDDENRRKLQDRFHNCRLEMEEVTAYTLLGNAVVALPGKEKEWEDKRETLWQGVERLLLHLNILGTDKLKKGELKKLVPVHPYAAYLLSYISKLYSSSQRTLFNFLKSDEPGGFQWFIKDNPRDEWYWLTADCLWQYFFENKNDAMELSEALSYVLSYYENIKEKVTNEEELRILRVILLLIALSRQQSERSSLHRPRFSTLKSVAFRGTSLEHRIEEIVRKLEGERLILVSDLGNDREFLLPGTRIDDNILSDGKKWVEQNKAFEKVIKQPCDEGGFKTDLEEMLSFTGAAKLRYPVQILAAKELKQRGVQAVNTSYKPYQVEVVLVLGCQDEDLYGIEEVAERITRELGCCLVVSEKAFGQKRWAAWSEQCVNAYCYNEMRDHVQKKYHENQMQKLNNDWLGEVKTGGFKIFFRSKEWNRNGINSLTEILEEIGDQAFPAGPEKISTTNTLYERPFGEKVAKKGLGIEKANDMPYREVVQNLQVIGLWEARDLANYSRHPLGQMQRAVDEFFARHGNKVRLVELWEELQKPPFGLMPSPIGLLLFARLLKKYVEGYYLYEGSNPQPLNPDRLAEILNQVVKGQRTAENYSIHHMSPEGEKFCELGRNLFVLSPEKTSYPEEARKNMREKLRLLGYPLWTIAYLQEGEDADFRRAIAALQGVLSYDREELKDEDMKEIVAIVIPQVRKIAANLDPTRMQQGMEKFWDLNEPRLRSFMSTLNLNAHDMREKLRGLLEEDVYLWKEEKVKEKLPEIVAELELVNALNELCGGKAQDINEASRYFRNVWFKSKLPLACFKKEQLKEVAEAIAFLEKVVSDPRQAVKEKRADEIREKASKLRELLQDIPSLIIRLVKEYTGQEINFDDAEEIYRSLPDLSHQAEVEVKVELERALSSLKRNKVIVDLERKWKEITDSSSPEEWSEKHRVPIQWVLLERGFLEFFDRFKERRNLCREEVEKMLSFLESKRGDMAVLRDEQSILKKFVDVAAGEYAALVDEEAMARNLRDYVYQEMGGRVDKWLLQQSRLLNLVRQWINSNYRGVFYHRVEEVLASISPEELKEFVCKLTAEDSLIGMRLLAAFNRREG